MIFIKVVSRYKLISVGIMHIPPKEKKIIF